MNKVQLFQSGTLPALQDKINEWLLKNQDIYIINSNISSVNTDAGVQFIFYIFYETSPHALEEVQEIAAAADNKAIDRLTNMDIHPQ